MNVLIIYPNGNALYPHSGAETRIWNLNYALINRNFNVSILHLENSKDFEDKELKKKCNVFYIKKSSFFNFYLTDLNPFFIFKLFQLVRKVNFDIIQLEFPWGFLITKLLISRKSFLIYDSQGIEGEFIDVASKNPKFPRFLKPLVKFIAKKYEKLVCKLSDVVINVSEVDRNYYIKNYKIDRSKTILIQTPSTLKLENKVRLDEYKLKSRKNLGLPLNKTIVIFHGGLPHPPNQEAFDLIKNFISPRIKNSDLLFVIAGYNLKKFKKDNIISMGFVKDLKDLLFSADFAIVPIISGSGMRIKCTDYIMSALPFITTKIGIEGIDFVKPGIEYLVYDKVDHEFIKGIIKLYENKELRNKIHLNLLKKSNYLNRNKFENRFFKLYSKLLSY